MGGCVDFSDSALIGEPVSVENAVKAAAEAADFPLIRSASVDWAEVNDEKSSGEGAGFGLDD